MNLLSQKKLVNLFNLRLWNHKLYSPDGRRKFRLVVCSFVGFWGLEKILETSFWSNRWCSGRGWIATPSEITDKNLLSLIHDEENAFFVNEDDATREKLKSGLNFFHSTTLDPFCWGASVRYLAKSQIGLPTYFKYNSAERVRHALDNAQLTVGRYKLDYEDFWKIKFEKSDDLESVKQELARTLCLSEDAKRFVIRYQLQIASNKYVPHFLDAACWTGCMTAAMGTSLFFNNRLTVFMRPGFRVPRYCSYAIWWFLALGAYRFLYNKTTVHYQLDNDMVVVKQDRKYLKGAVEFYDHCLKRNKLLIKVLPNREYEYFFRTKNGNRTVENDVPLRQRLSEVRGLYKDYIDLE